MKKLYMGTTSISPQKTVSEIMTVLVASGARQIATDYGVNGSPKGLRFSIGVNGTDHTFALPVRPESLLKYLRGNREQAERVAWRQLLRWVQAQLAMIEVGMVRAEEVYVPYMIQPGTQHTLFEIMTGSHFKMLPAPEVRQ